MPKKNNVKDRPRMQKNLIAKKDIKAILAVLSNDVEWGEPENPFNPSGGTKNGHKGFLEWLRVGKESEDIIVLQPRHFLVGDDNVAVVGYTKCLAKSTGKSYATDFVHLVTIKDGKIVRFQENLFYDIFNSQEKSNYPRRSDI